jgi:hypothetical protein
MSHQKNLHSFLLMQALVSPFTCNAESLRNPDDCGESPSTAGAQASKAVSDLLDDVGAGIDVRWEAALSLAGAAIDTADYIAGDTGESADYWSREKPSTSDYSAEDIQRNEQYFSRHAEAAERFVELLTRACAAYRADIEQIEKL